MRAVFYLSIIFLTFSCTQKEIEKPENLIDQATMEQILYDLAMLQAIKGHDAKLLPKNQIDPRKYIFQKYKIDSLQLVKSNRYYAADLENYKLMYNNVIEKVKAEKKKVATQIIKEAKKPSKPKNKATDSTATKKEHTLLNKKARKALRVQPN